MSRVRVARTLSEDVLTQLRGEILSGRLAPGTRLKMTELSDRLGVSLSVLREALNRLFEQGLVTLEPQVGFRVVTLSADELLDLTAARVQVEVAALRESVRRGGLEWEASLLAAHHTLARTPLHDQVTPATGATQAWIAAHAAFHQALIAGCGSRRLLAIVSSLRESMELYRQWAGATGEATGRDIAAEHQTICEAALDHDADRAAELLADHIQRTADLLLSRAPQASA